MTKRLNQKRPLDLQSKVYIGTSLLVLQYSFVDKSILDISNAGGETTKGTFIYITSIKYIIIL